MGEVRDRQAVSRLSTVQHARAIVQEEQQLGGWLLATALAAQGHGHAVMLDGMGARTGARRYGSWTKRETRNEKRETAVDCVQCCALLDAGARWSTRGVAVGLTRPLQSA